MADIEAVLIHGYKLRLSDWTKDLDLSVLDGDDWQIFHEEEDKEELIKKYVTGKDLQDWLLVHPAWNLYFLTSTQDDPDPDNSFVYIFDKIQSLYYGQVPDYETGEINISFEVPTDGPPLDVSYQQHWVVTGGW